MKMTLKKTTVVIALLFISVQGFSLKYGDPAPDLQIAKWIKGNPVDLKSTTGEKKIYVIFFFATWPTGTDNLVRFVTQQTETFKDAGAVFIGISKENEAPILEFIKKYPEINFNVAMDDKLKTYNEYMKSAEGLPYFMIFDNNAKMLWKGSPIEEANVLLKVIGGTFDPDKQIAIEDIRAKMNQAIQSFDFDSQTKYAKDILQLDPTDKAASDIIINDYIKSNKIQDCLNFVKDLRMKAANNKYVLFSFYMTELDIVRGILDKNGREQVRRLTANYMDSFKNDPVPLNTFMIRMIQLVPLEFLPLKEMLAIATSNIELGKKINNETSYANFLQTMARVQYYIGNIDKAVSFQADAIARLKDKDAIATANMALEYYKEAKNLHGSSK